MESTDYPDTLMRDVEGAMQARWDADPWPRCGWALPTYLWSGAGWTGWSNPVGGDFRYWWVLALILLIVWLTDR